jgi:hypothetical protein
VEIGTHKNIILPVILYEYKHLSLTLREEQRFRLFEDRAMRKIFVLRRDEVTGRWRTLRNEEHNKLYSSLGIVKMIEPRNMRWADHVARMGEKSNAYKIFMGKLEGNRLVGGPKRRWANSVIMDEQDIGYGGTDWLICLRTGTGKGLM